MDVIVEKIFTFWVKTFKKNWKDNAISSIFHGFKWGKQNKWKSC